ncbi:MAG: hypothetical protein Q8O88_04335, partial [bacterium]|nr:hypothetical protein [bacterium]
MNKHNANTKQISIYKVYKTEKAVDKTNQYVAADSEIFDYNSGLPLKIADIVENKIKCKVLSLKLK